MGFPSVTSLPSPPPRPCLFPLHTSRRERFHGKGGSSVPAAARWRQVSRPALTCLFLERRFCRAEFVLGNNGAGSSSGRHDSIFIRPVAGFCYNPVFSGCGNSRETLRRFILIRLQSLHNDMIFIMCYNTATGVERVFLIRFLRNCPVFSLKRQTQTTYHSSNTIYPR